MRVKLDTFNAAPFVAPSVSVELKTVRLQNSRILQLLYEVYA